MKTEFDKRMTRRAAFKAGAGLAAGVAAARVLGSEANAADAAAMQRFESQGKIDPKHRILIKGATIVSLDPKVGNLLQGDVLIEGKKIAAVGPSLKAANAQVIDGKDSIVVPGFIDCHRHAWEGQLRRINPNAATLAEYSNATHLSFGKFYRPQDMYVGNYITALGCIDSGVTCFIDNSHNARSAAHSDAAVEALIDSGARAVHASGQPFAGDWDKQWPADLERLQKKYFSSDDQLVTLRMMSGPIRSNFELARKLNLRITSEFNGSPQGEAALAELWEAKLVGPENTLNHCGGLSDKTWQIIRDANINVNVCPRSDAQYGLAEGICAYQAALDRGIKVGFSVDNETSYSTDMFMEMRVALYIQRAVAQNRRFHQDQNAPAAVTVRDVLECATVNGAVVAGLSNKIGSVTPGKEADLLVIRTDEINLYPSSNAIGTVVQAAERSNIDTVIIGGRVRKFRGKLVGLDMAKLRRMTEESRGYLFAKVGYHEDVFAESLPKLS